MAALQKRKAFVVNFSREVFFFKNYAEHETGKLVLDLSLFFKSKW